MSPLSTMASYGFSSNSNMSPLLTWQRVTDWAEKHYRCRTFSKDEQIPARPGLLYLVQRGAVRLIGLAAPGSGQGTAAADPEGAADPVGTTLLAHDEEAFLGFVGAGQPFEMVAQEPFILQSFAHVDETVVIWLYWQDLETWPHFHREISDAFRYQHQRKLLWLSTLGQRRTRDRLLGFLTLLMEEFGEPCPQGYYLPWSLTHAQIGSAIGSTRVTVTRLMGKLRQEGVVQTYEDGFLCLRLPRDPAPPLS